MANSLTIAIASGKGGTGKTTVATNLALCAAGRGLKVQYLDCDVEEPNGHIFLKPRIEKQTAVTADVPEVDAKKCTGCGKCGQVCQYAAIMHIKDKTVVTFDALCHSCGGCWRLCPAEAIKPKALEIGQIESGNSNGVGFVHGKLRIGSVRSVTMINNVKQHIDDEALSIIDVPPGTSCPVVAAVKGADYVLLVTEPTPFGLNDLKLAVDLMREMKLPFSVVINRHGCGDDQVETYCRDDGIEIAAKIPNDRKIAECYSTGHMIVKAMPKYKQLFENLLSNMQVPV